MKKCEHGQNIQIFCISQYCQWKEAGGCNSCIKKYHNHIGHSKFMTLNDLQKIMKKFQIDHSSKPNCRKIQQAIYAYFSNIKHQFINSIDLLCKNFITQLGSPYLYTEQLYTVHKRIKNEQYKRVNQKQLRKFASLDGKITNQQVFIEQGKIYKELLRKNQKNIQNIEFVFKNYEETVKPFLENYLHKSQYYNSIIKLIKLTLEENQSNLQNFHKYSLEKNSKRSEKNQKLQILEERKITSLQQQLKQKTLKNNSDILSNPKSARISSKEDESQITLLNNFSSTFYTSKRDNNVYKTGFTNLQKVEKPQKRATSKGYEKRKQVSLDKKINEKNKDSLKKEHELILGNYKLSKEKKLYVLQNLEKNGQKSQSQSSSLQKKVLTKEDQIALRKQQLIEMMKNNTRSVLNQDKINNQSPFKFKQSPIKKIDLGDTQQVLSPNSSSPKKILNRKQKDLQVNHRIQTQNGSFQQKVLPQWNVKSIKNINNVNENKVNKLDDSLQHLEKLIPETNMYAHSRLPVAEFQEHKRQPVHSRLIIVPAPQQINRKKAECDSPLLKKRAQYKNKPQFTLKIEQVRTLKQKAGQDETNSQLNSKEKGSIDLLLQAIKLPPTKAIPLLQKSLHTAPNNLSTAQYLSFLFLQNSQPYEALKVCNRILQKIEITKQNEGDLIDLQINKAAALNSLGRYSQTIILLQKCFKIKEKPTLFKNLGDAYFFAGNYEKAIYNYEKAINSYPEYDEANFNMAVCLYHQNNYHHAKIAVMKALEINGKDEAYKELEQEIKSKLKRIESPSKKY